VTRINIDWSGNGAIEMPPQQDVQEGDDCCDDMEDADGEVEGLHEGQEFLTEEDTIDVDQMQMESNRIM
jgi:hypothetical protein